MKRFIVAIAVVALMAGVASAEWRVEEAPKQLPGTKAPFDPEASREMRSLQHPGVQVREEGIPGPKVT